MSLPRKAKQGGPVVSYQKSSRVTLNLHDAARQELVDLAKATHLNMTDLVRLALIVFKVVYENQKSGNVIKIFRNDGGHITDILLPV